ncbi:MAG TPA: periplasmic heavy metal sensor [Vicinamibacterales bacterium]|nr:periplasmic heavy metal sensor [Vicinamibacterales bacterium]
MSLPLNLRVTGALAAALALVVGFAMPATAQGFKWWQDERFQQELAMSAEQIARLEDIYQSAGPAMRSQKGALDRLQRELSELVSDGRADEATADDLITRVEGARAELGHTRGVMLYRMRRILTSDQHVKLKVLFEEHERERHPRPKPKQ